MNPTDLVQYWSTRPLDKDKFFNMIHRDYKVVVWDFKNNRAADGDVGVISKNLQLLKDFLYQSNGQRPAIVEFSADDDSGLHGEIEFLIYFSPDVGPSAADIDTSYNPISDEEVVNYLNGNNSYTGISNYGEGDEGQLPGIEIEFERIMVTVFEDEDQWNTTQYSLREFLQDSLIQYDAANYGYTCDKVSAYLQLEYTGLKNYPILNHPGGIR